MALYQTSWFCTKSLGFVPTPHGLVRNHERLIQNSKGFAFSYETLKGFVLKGSEVVPKVRTFKGFVDLKNRFLSILRHLDAISNLRNLFSGFGKIPFFLECIMPVLINDDCRVCIKCLCKLSAFRPPIIGVNSLIGDCSKCFHHNV